tara:strand:- start:8140 stop:8790 length:651 start_codon:yes stop_codon:yes gene_type:complete
MGKIKKIWICAYREWALEISNQVKNEVKCDIITSKEQFNKIEFEENDIIFFLGWSWIIPSSIIKECKCICLHPSPLPKYRGGSPIQHQIINGETLSAVTFFIMTDKLDEGDILYQEYFSLEGDLKDIFSRIIPLGTSGIFRILTQDIKGKSQNESEATLYKRRKPSESEILLSDIQNLTSKQLYNKIRALQDPYPNSYIRCKNGSKLYITKSKYEK